MSGVFGFFKTNIKKTMPVLWQEYMLFSCLPLSRPQATQHISAYLSIQGRGGGILLAEDGQIFLTCLQLVGTWVKNIFRNLVPYFLMSSASGYMGEKHFQEFGARFLACHVIFGVSCSKCCVSWCVNIYRVNEFRVMSCQNSLCERVHAMPWPP